MNHRSVVEYTPQLGDLARAQVDLDDARAVYAVYRTVRRLSLGVATVGALLALAAVALTVTSSLVGFDAGTACGALYGAGSIAATLGAIAVGSWSRHFHWTSDETRDAGRIYTIVTPRRAVLAAEEHYRAALARDLETS